jgi:hypothetical protein
MQHPRQLFQFLHAPHRVHFHAAVIQVARISGQTQPDCRTLREVAVAYALHLSADEPPARRFLA